MVGMERGCTLAEMFWPLLSEFSGSAPDGVNVIAKYHSAQKTG